MNTSENAGRNAPRPELASQELDDISLLLGEIVSLHKQLDAARLRAANLEAAMRAALSADHDGEEDPLFYLRDELAGDSGGRV